MIDLMVYCAYVRMNDVRVDDGNKLPIHTDPRFTIVPVRSDDCNHKFRGGIAIIGCIRFADRFGPERAFDHIGSRQTHAIDRWTRGRIPFVEDVESVAFLFLRAVGSASIRIVRIQRYVTQVFGTLRSCF